MASLSRANYMRRWRQERIKQKLCTTCDNPAGGEYHCPKCKEKRKQYHKNYSKSYNPGYWAANKDAINARRRKAG